MLRRDARYIISKAIIRMLYCCRVTAVGNYNAVIIRKGRKYMIILTKLNGEKFMLNPDLIEIVTENPDTVITTSTGHSYIVEQSMNEILSLIKEYRQSLRRQRLERSI